MIRQSWRAASRLGSTIPRIKKLMVPTQPPPNARAPPRAVSSSPSGMMMRRPHQGLTTMLRASESSSAPPLGTKIFTPISRQICQQRYKIRADGMCMPTAPPVTALPAGPMVVRGDSLRRRHCHSCWTSSRIQTEPGRRGERMVASAVAGPDEKLEVKREALTAIFEGSDYLFSTRANMREYSWDKDLTEELVMDIIQNMTMSWQRNVQDVSLMDAYELGQIVVVKDESPKNFVILLQDGQQRIITLCLLLASLRDIFRNSSHERKNSLAADIDNYLMEPGSRNRDQHPRVQMREKQGILLARILQPGNSLRDILAETNGKRVSKQPKETDVDAKVRTNASVIQQMLEAESVCAVERGLVDSVDEFASCLLDYTMDRCQMMVYSTSDKRQAHRQIRRQGRGQDQSPSDIFKFEVLVDNVYDENMSDGLVEQWNSLEKDSTAAHFETSLLALATSKLRKRHRTNSEDDHLAAWFLRYSKDFKGSSTDDIGKSFFLEELKPGVKIASHLLNGSLPQEVTGSERPHLQLIACVRSLSRAASLRSRQVQWLPLALHLIDEADGDLSKLYESFRRLERMQMFFMLTGVTAPKQTKRCLDAMIEPHKMDLTTDEKAEFLARLSEPFLKAKESVAKAVLFRLNEWESISAGEPLLDRTNPYTLEHCLPQKCKSGSQWELDFDEDAHTYWVGRLANLLLLAGKRNSTIGNNDFVKKASHFRKTVQSHFPLTTRAFDCDNWTIEVLQKRQESYQKKAEDIWFGRS